MKSIKITVLLLLTMGCVACSHSSNEYLSSETTPPLRTPKGMSPLKRESNYPVPAAKKDKSLEEVTLTPPGTNLLNR